MSAPSEWVAVVLSSGTAPARAALEVVSVAVATNGADLYTVRQPTGNAAKTLLFNGPTPLAAGVPGSASNRSNVRGLANVTSGEVGPVNASWTLQNTASTKTHRVIGGARSGSYRLERIAGGGGSSGDFGFARLRYELLTTDATQQIEDYTPILGSSTPGPEPATVANPNALAGAEDATVVVVLTPSGWAIAAVIDFRDAEHGFCRPYADFTSGDTTVQPVGYQSVEGVEAPASGSASLSNALGFAATTEDTLAVAKRSGVWQIRYVIPGGSDARPVGVCKIGIDYSLGNPPDAGDIENFAYLIGSGSAPTALENPTPVSYSAGDTLLLVKIDSDWVIRYAIPKGSGPTRHGVATLTSALSSSGDGAVGSYRPEEGAALPAPTTASNPHSLTGQSGDDVDVTWTGSAWAIVAVRRGSERRHGVATLSAALTTSGTATVTNYRPEEGNASPAPTTATNPHSLAGASGEEVDLTFDGTSWIVVAVRKIVERRHGVATLTAALTSGGSASLTGYRAEEGADSPAPTTATNPANLTAGSGDDVDVTFEAGAWRVVAVRKNTERRHGVATLTADLQPLGFATVSSYRAEEGSATPAPTSASNPSGLSGVTGNDVDLTLVGSTWNVVAIRRNETQSHGVATLTAPLTAIGTASIGSYRAQEGVGGPGSSAANPSGLTGQTGDEVDVALIGTTWRVIAVRKATVVRHGVATLSADTASGEEAELTGYRAEEGAETPAPTAAANPHSLSGKAGDEVDVASDGVQWRLVAIRRAASSGGSSLVPVMVYDNLTAATADDNGVVTLGADVRYLPVVPDGAGYKANLSAAFGQAKVWSLGELSLSGTGCCGDSNGVPPGITIDPGMGADGNDRAYLYDAQEGAIVVRGRGVAPGAGVTVTIGSLPPITATNNGDGTWTAPGQSLASLAKGVYPVTATDGATSDTLLVTYGFDDTTEELGFFTGRPPSPDMTSATDTGESTEDNKTSDRTPTFACAHGSVAPIDNGGPTPHLYVKGVLVKSGLITDYTTTPPVVSSVNLTPDVNLDLGRQAAQLVLEWTDGSQVFYSPPSLPLRIDIDPSAIETAQPETCYARLGWLTTWNGVNFVTVDKCRRVITEAEKTKLEG